MARMTTPLSDKKFLFHRKNDGVSNIVLKEKRNLFLLETIQMSRLSLQELKELR